MITLNFREESIFELIKSGKKTVETRALNPDEPERYFGNIKAGDDICLISATTGESILKKVLRASVYKDFNKYLQTEDLSKVFGKKISQGEALEKYLSFPGYKERLDKYGIIAIEF